MRFRLAAILLAAACVVKASPGPEVRPPAPSIEAADPSTRVAWSEVEGEIEALICVRTIDVPERGKVDIPAVGDREACKLPPPRTATERAVLATFEEAQPVLISLAEEGNAAFGVLQADTLDPKVEAVRRAYLTPRFVGVLSRFLSDALEAEGLVCDGCPEPAAAPRREVAWSEFEPYLLAHVWPDPVVTLVGADGKRGRPTIQLHICGGINGVGGLDDPVAVLVQAGYLAAFHNEAIRDRAGAVLGAVRENGELDQLATDEERTVYLRRTIGPRLLADRQVKERVCDLLERFEVHTGVVVKDCR